MVRFNPNLNMWCVSYNGDIAYFKYKYVAEQVLKFWKLTK